jgi:hypothetical protein
VILRKNEGHATIYRDALPVDSGFSYNLISPSLQTFPSLLSFEASPADFADFAGPPPHAAASSFVNQHLILANIDFFGSCSMAPSFFP